MKRYYFDHASATPVLPEVVDAMKKYWDEDFGNPSAINQEGVAAKHALDEARGIIAARLGVAAKTCVFTSSTTESVRLALVGAVDVWRKDHQGETPEIMVSAVEHDCVLETARQLEAQGVIVRYVPVDTGGVVDVDDLASRITSNTVVVSVMLVNNEIGTVQPLADIAHAIRRWKRDVRGLARDKAPTRDDAYPLLHTDATQAVNYYELNVPRLGVDMLSCNSSKIYGPKGVGLLYHASYATLSPTLVGGGQEGGLRAGTEPVALAVGFAEAFEHAQRDANEESVRLMSLRAKLFLACEESAKQHDTQLYVNGVGEYVRVPNNVNVSFANVDHEYLALALDAEGVAVATKSACNEREAEESHVIAALADARGGDATRPLSGLRITTGRGTDDEDVEAFSNALKRVLPLAFRS